MSATSKEETKVVAARVPKSSADELEQIAEKEQIDKSTVIIRALHKYLKEWKLQNALTLYRQGKVTLWKAASLAGISLWEMMDITKERKIPMQYTFKDFKEDFEAALKEK